MTNSATTTTPDLSLTAEQICTRNGWDYNPAPTGPDMSNAEDRFYVIEDGWVR